MPEEHAVEDLRIRLIERLCRVPERAIVRH